MFQNENTSINPPPYAYLDGVQREQAEKFYWLGFEDGEKQQAARIVELEDIVAEALADKIHQDNVIAGKNKLLDRIAAGEVVRKVEPCPQP